MLVSYTFLINNDNLPTVDHIDINCSNNNVNNLRWTSYKTQCINKKVYKKDKFIEI